MLRFQRLLVVATVLLAVALTCRAQTKAAYSSPPLTEEQLSVYRGFLDSFAALKIKNLSKVTLPLDFYGFPEGRPCLSGIELESPSVALTTAHAFVPEITKARELKLVDPTEQVKLLEESNKTELNFLIFSEIAFDREHKFAVLKYVLVCGKHCASGATLVMEKVDGRWTPSSRRPCAQFIE